MRAEAKHSFRGFSFPSPLAARTFPWVVGPPLLLGRNVNRRHCDTASSSSTSAPDALSASKIDTRHAGIDRIKRKAQKQIPPNSQLTEKHSHQHLSTNRDVNSDQQFGKAAKPLLRAIPSYLVTLYSSDPSIAFVAGYSDRKYSV